MTLDPAPSRRSPETLAEAARVGASLGLAWRASVDPAWLTGWEPRRFSLEGGETEVVAMGEGPPLVLLPPLPGSKEAWVGSARLLARSFRVVTFDLRCRFSGAPSWSVVLSD